MQQEGEIRWQQGLREALARLLALSPYVAAAKSGCDYRQGSFAIPLLQRVFLISYPQGEIRDLGKEAPPPPWLHIILLHYLLTADGTSPADSWITYRYLPGALLFESRFRIMAIRPLEVAFGQDIEGFRRAARALGGEAMSRSGDAAFRFRVLPHLPMACLLYLGDEEMPPSVSLLFDVSAPRYLPTEDLYYLGGYLSRSLIGQRGNPNLTFDY